MGAETGFNWYGLISQIVAVMIGGLLVIATNELAERRRKNSVHEEFEEHQRAVYTGVFTVKNFIAEQLNAFLEPNSDIRDLLSLEAAQSNLHRLIDKSRPDGQALLLVLFDASLHLDDLLATLHRSIEEGSPDTARLANKIEAVRTAFDQFELFAEASLEFMSEDEIEEMMGRHQPT